MTETFFFGRAESPLFGVYHAPLSAADRELGIVVCAPLGREYTKAHRALRQLALRLARLGFHVLRFDYRGCGDSSGEPVDVDLARWAQDVGVAADELLDRTGLVKVGLVGLRLGATLALLSARQRRDVEALVLWEPVLDGRRHLEELRASTAKWQADRGFPPEGVSPEGAIGILGFPMGPSLRESLEGLDWALDRRPARRTLLLRETPDLADAALTEQLKKHAASVQVNTTPAERFWLDADNGTRMFVPTASLQVVTAWLSGETP
jgi:exosortase A-associated hydrolase 2